MKGKVNFSDFALFLYNSDIFWYIYTVPFFFENIQINCLWLAIDVDLTQN